MITSACKQEEPERKVPLDPTKQEVPLHPTKQEVPVVRPKQEEFE